MKGLLVVVVVLDMQNSEVKFHEYMGIKSILGGKNCINCRENPKYYLMFVGYLLIEVGMMVFAIR